MSVDQFQDFLDILTGLSKKQKLVIASFEQRFILGKEQKADMVGEHRRNRDKFQRR